MQNGVIRFLLDKVVRQYSNEIQGGSIFMSTNLDSVLQGGGLQENVSVIRKRYGPHESTPRKTGSVESFLDTIVGRYGGLRAILAQAQAVAPTDATVLITGETGTGKEVIARAIHELSPRRGRNLVKVNWAAMPAGLLETELFGHERGAFTGAVNSRVGRFALADHGTLFLDEIGDMPLELQPKLLRVLQEREFEPVGSIRTTRVDVRVVAATNRDLRHMVGNKEFREDLYYRLNTFPVFLPPLRERKSDIPELVNYFVQHYAESMGKRIESIPEETMRVLVRHPWPGNIRELQNYIARAVILSTDGIFESLPLEQFESPVAQEIANPTLEEKVRQEIINACRQANWMLGGSRGAAARLGLKRTTLYHKMYRLGIRRPVPHSPDSVGWAVPQN
jgi:formate hydrogenlyase transcriptional activator